MTAETAPTARNPLLPPETELSREEALQLADRIAAWPAFTSIYIREGYDDKVEYTFWQGGVTLEHGQLHPSEMFSHEDEP